MGSKKDTIKFLEAQNGLLRAEIDRLKLIVDSKDRQISCLNEMVALESRTTGEKKGREWLRTMTECCCENKTRKGVNVEEKHDCGAIFDEKFAKVREVCARVL